MKQTVNRDDIPDPALTLNADGEDSPRFVRKPLLE